MVPVLNNTTLDVRIDILPKTCYSIIADPNPSSEMDVGSAFLCLQNYTLIIPLGSFLVASLAKTLSRRLNDS